MSDKIPGSAYHNPVWYKEKWRIYVNDIFPFNLGKYCYVHDDYDGAEDANDNRCGFAPTIEACKAEIDEREDEQ